ncbi:hypothetical protein HQQ82_12660 [Rathayibacter sp. VKM Ac-2856]|uniref:hypothetical protein n=1 Tax=unclassified Rathayibacter TaxID=2609250 RepID=UPI0015659DF2|nr:MULTISPECIES: hypothetical protein [unclassified Rathayibacter]NQX05296.1 hypothetical protein [Rathayibacter sp. VKM Ac-2858]NQX20829.1 hypothetical protein [Rathayibacter sp. VKM Ac-2856]
MTTAPSRRTAPSFAAPSRRTVATAAAWSVPIVAVAASAPLAAASTTPPPAPSVRSVEYTSFTAQSFREEQVNVNRPLAIAIDGQLSAGELITLTVAPRMARSDTSTGAGDSRPTPLRISAADGPNFSVASSSVGADGSQTLLLRANRDLADGAYRKTITWVPVDGRTSEQTVDLLLTWPLGTYTAPITVSVAGVAGSEQAYTLNRTPVGGADE